MSRLGRVRLDRYLATRVVEACVHGLDLRDALNAPPTPTPVALRVTVWGFEQALERRGSVRPLDLADDVAFIEAATGRRSSSDPNLPLLQ